jgi:hypothetical protein
MGAPIRLLRELVRMADQWAKPPLSVSVAMVAGGG